MTEKNNFTFRAYNHCVDAINSLVEDYSFQGRGEENKDFMDSLKQTRLFFLQMKELRSIETYKILPVYSIAFYYTIFFMLRTYLLYKGIQKEQIGSHTSLIRTANNICLNEPDFFGFPFNVLYDGIEKKYINFPQGFIHRTCKKMKYKDYMPSYSFANPEDEKKRKDYSRLHGHVNFEIEENVYLEEKPFDITQPLCVKRVNGIDIDSFDTFLTFIRTTSERKITDYKKRNKGKKISLSQAGSLSSVFDFFFRYRERLNYKDLSAFSFMEGDQEAKRYCAVIGENLWKIARCFARGMPTNNKERI